MNTKHATRPTVSRIHAEEVATMAAYRARIAGASETTCARVLAETYAQIIREG